MKNTNKKCRLAAFYPSGNSRVEFVPHNVGRPIRPHHQQIYADRPDGGKILWDFTVCLLRK